MSEERRRRQALRQEMLELGKEWDFAPTLWEENICKELQAKEIIEVPRVPAEQLAWMRMPSNKCHDNARWYAENDPSGTSRAVIGWWVQWPNYVLHSIVSTQGQLACITPSHFSEPIIHFIPDPEIDLQRIDDRFVAIRDGHEIGPGIRVYPEFTMAQNAIVRERLLSGMDPYKACEFSNEQMDELKRKYIKESV